MKNTDKSLSQLRQEIDAIDAELITTLFKRNQVVVMIGAYKKRHGIQPLDQVRWNQVLDSRIALGDSLGLPLTLVSQVFEIIHHHSLLVQEPN